MVLKKPGLAWIMSISLLWGLALQACSASKPVGEGRGDLRKQGTGVSARGDLAALRVQARALENRVRKLEVALGHLSPGGPLIVVDTSPSRIALMLGSRVVVQGTCSTGNGMELTDAAGKRSARSAH